MELFEEKQHQELPPFLLSKKEIDERMPQIVPMQLTSVNN